MKKRSDGRYAKTVTVGVKDGKLVRKTIYGRTQKELDANYREYMDALGKGVVLSDQGVTFKEFSERWLRNKKEPVVKPQTLHGYADLLSVLNRYFGSTKVTDISARQIERFRDDYTKDRKFGSYSALLKVLKQVLEYAIDDGIVTRNVARSFPVCTDAPDKRSLTDLEMRKIDKADLTARQRCMIDLLRYTGIRRGEMLALTTGDIDMENRRICIDKIVIDNGDVQHSTKTRSSTRFVPIMESLMPSLTAYLAELERNSLLFPRSRRDEAMTTTTFYREWREISARIFGDAVPKDFTPHIFRHSFATWCYRSGLPVEVTQKLLGHSSIRITMDIYTHLSTDDVNADALDKFFKLQSKCSQNVRKTQ